MHVSKRGIAAALALLPMASLAQAVKHGPLERVASFYGPMPTGVTVSHKGRIFINYPHWGDDVKFTVAEVVGGKPVAYPNAQINKINKAHPDKCLYSVQSVVVDPKDRLWALDTGSVKLGPNVPGGPKLVCMDLTTNKITRTILFPRSVVPAPAYLNDVRFDLTRGTGGMAYITDSGVKGPCGIIVVDLASGKSYRRLGNTKSVKPEPGLTLIVEGEPMLERLPGKPPKEPGFGSDGIAMGAGGKRLYYSPVLAHHLYSVSMDALSDPSRSEADVEQTVVNEGARPTGSDGLEADTAGRVYCTADERNSIIVRLPSGKYQTIAQDPRLLWPDTMSLATNGYLYVTANQLHRQGRYHNGHDLRRQPYGLFRIKVDARPVLLTK